MVYLWFLIHISPGKENRQFVNRVMFDSEWNKVSMAHKPCELLIIRLPFAVSKNDMIRKI